jgi:cytochrome c oxidase subunit 1
VVHRWAYDYSVPGLVQDFVPQTLSEQDEAALARQPESRESSGEADS